MKILVIGGTQFIGPPLVQSLLNRGHQVTLFHRGHTHDDRASGASVIIGDRKQLANYTEQFKNLQPDLVLDMIPFTPDDGRELVETIKGITPRVVALGSADVYLAYGRLHRTEPGPLVPTPLTEQSPLRQTDKPHGYIYDKISVEKHVMGSSEVAGTVLRLPAIYGPKDQQHRFYQHLKRMDDGRPAIIMPESRANWRFMHAYVDNIAHAVLLAVESEKAAGQIYNVSEAETPTERERLQRLSQAAGWSGEIVVLPEGDCPKHLLTSNDLSQEMTFDDSKIRNELGYREIVPEQEALERTIAWLRANPPPQIDPKSYDYEAEDEALKRIGII